MEELEQEEDWTVIDWNQGATLMTVIAIGSGIILGLPMLINKPEMLFTPSVLFYILLYVFAAAGHYDDVIRPRIKGKDVTGTLIGGLLGYLIIQIMFLFGLTMLRTPNGGLALVPLTRFEAIIFNLGFVVAGEELIFRDTLPFLLSIGFVSMNIKGYSLEERDAVIFAFLISSVLFGLLHWTAYNFDPIALVQAVVAGVVLSIMRIKWGLGASYLAHALFNVLNLLGAFAILPMVT